MTEDATLADFLDVDESADSKAGNESADSEAGDGERSDSAERTDGTTSDSGVEAAERGGGPSEGTADDATADAAVEPVRTTYAWGAARTCADCGSTVERAWRDEGEYICAACKSW